MGRAIYDLSPRLVPWLARAGVVAAVVASLSLFVATATVGIPSRQADDGLGPEISEPAQLGLAVHDASLDSTDPDDCPWSSRWRSTLS